MVDYRVESPAAAATRLLVGEGRHMRHVKLRPDVVVDAAALERLVDAAYRDILTGLDDCR